MLTARGQYARKILLRAVVIGGMVEPSDVTIPIAQPWPDIDYEPPELQRPNRKNAAPIPLLRVVLQTKTF